MLCRNCCIFFGGGTGDSPVASGNLPEATELDRQVAGQKQASGLFHPNTMVSTEHVAH
jgi:hypothetical protein